MKEENKNLNANIIEKEKKCKNLRSTMIEYFSKKGGNLSSNLEKIELMTEINDLFNLEQDNLIIDNSRNIEEQLIFDKETYKIHKTNSANKALSMALGISSSNLLDSKNDYIISIIESSSFNINECDNLFKKIGENHSKNIIILNDSKEIIPNIDFSYEYYINKIKKEVNFFKSKRHFRKTLTSLELGKKIYGLLKLGKNKVSRINNKIKNSFNKYNIDYYGPVNAHDFSELNRYLTLAKESNYPVLIHLISKKGKGYIYAENDSENKWENINSFDIETGVEKNENKPTSNEIMTNILIKEMNKDLVIITPLNNKKTNLLKLEKMYPSNYIYANNINESLAIARGLSVTNKIPFVYINANNFTDGVTALINDIAKNNTHIIIGIDESDIKTNGIFTLPISLQIPNLIISTPKDSAECINILKIAINTPSPFIIRYNSSTLNENINNEEITEIGSWEQLEKGSDGTLITYGSFIKNSLEIIEQLKNIGIKLELVNARFQKPIDTTYMNKITKKKKPIFVYEESMESGSLGSFLGTKYSTNIITFGIDDLFIKENEEKQIITGLELNTKAIVNKIAKEIGKENTKC